MPRKKKDEIIDVDVEFVPDETPPIIKKGRKANTHKASMLQDWKDADVYNVKLDLIKSLSMQGYSQAEIAQELGISLPTLRNYMKQDETLNQMIKTGRSYVVAKCQNALMQQVERGNIIAIMYALKVYGGDFFNDKFAPRQAETIQSIENNLKVLIEAINAPSSVAEDEDTIEPEIEEVDTNGEDS